MQKRLTTKLTPNDAEGKYTVDWNLQKAFGGKCKIRTALGISSENPIESRLLQIHVKQHTTNVRQILKPQAG